MSYKIGDKVEIVGNTSGHRHKIGCIGVIEDMVKPGTADAHYRVRNTSTGERWWCKKADLIKRPPAKTKGAKAL